MVEDVAAWASWSLGLEAEILTAGHMAVRAVVVFIFAVAIVRLGKKRFISENTAFDVILGVMLGSIVSRAITGQSPFFATLCAGVVLVMLHWAFAHVAYRWDWFGTMIKGDTRVLVRDGEVDWSAMRRSDLTRHDLLEALRLKASRKDPALIEEARLERNGEISIILKEDRDAGG